MRQKDLALADAIEDRLVRFSNDMRPLPGIQQQQSRTVLARQFVASIHRVRFVHQIVTRDISPRRADPNDEFFDPVRAAAYHQRTGDLDEAFWCVFLFVHFGKHARGGYRYCREVYGRLGDGSIWDWTTTAANPAAFRRWLSDNEGQIRREGAPGGFGNHRKYQSLSGRSSRGTGATVESYVNWVAPPRTHEQLVAHALATANDHRDAFDMLYRSMNDVIQFGRMARFDYLSMVGKLGLAEIEPGSAYLAGATGPYAGACLLFGDEATAQVRRTTVDGWLVDLASFLEVGMQTIEDALCNWQKSPREYAAFRG